MARPVICVNDKTSHGGVVVEGFSDFSLDGRTPSGVGHKVTCPKCGGVFPIVGPGPAATIKGTEIAVEGMFTACGATLIASQTSTRID